MIRNALTVDVEDYFQVSAFAASVNRSDWDSIPRRVTGSTQRLLDLFAGHGVSATFFVLGWVAEREPQLVKSIAAAGHEVACHGYGHELVYNQSPAQFREETMRSKALLEDIVQKPVNGYRAASYSITRRSLWALDILGEAGFTYDSSIFPVHHDRYGIPGTPTRPYRLLTDNGTGLHEFPLSSANLLGYRLPVAGGGYFRIYPYRVTHAGLSQINRGGEPFIFYLHPWEIDTQQPRIRAGLVSRFRHYINLGRCEARLRRLCTDFTFTTVADVLRGYPLETVRIA